MNEQYNQPSKPPVLMMAGKTAVMKELCNNFGYHKCITATSREPRPGEVGGVDYFFLNRAAFERQLRNMEFA
ncbi:hypothetical protein I3271_07580 [Photobacterium leiognathi]|uniref:hypothetical protein n=1 Tax=Photobacterium leiognathi TaxID=553611 RepID=UPI001EDE287D|nr:hypothetical protein [Photobacterium leiognathi]MCG3884547.1 hypothetical protein [Photobacterium leiognathi]